LFHAGAERYRSLAPMYYRGAAAAIVVFSVTDRVRVVLILPINCSFVSFYLLFQLLVLSERMWSLRASGLVCWCERLDQRADAPWGPQRRHRTRWQQVRLVASSNCNERGAACVSSVCALVYSQCSAPGTLMLLFPSSCCHSSS
jgi:hypothetical protein